MTDETKNAVQETATETPKESNNTQEITNLKSEFNRKIDNLSNSQKSYLGNLVCKRYPIDGNVFRIYHKL